jgi:hypothetical protein
MLGSSGTALGTITASLTFAQEKGQKSCFNAPVKRFIERSPMVEIASLARKSCRASSAASLITMSV